MAERMLQFTHVERKMPDKREAKARADDFAEIYAEFSKEAAGAQAARCSQCGVPFCQQGCPLSNNIPDWLKLAAENRLEEAWQVSSATNNMPEICGRICPQDRLCEGICTIQQSGHGTVTIGSIEKYITDTAWEEGWVTPIKPPRERSQSAGIIGAGPGGLAAAEQLRRKGYRVTVYDAYDRGGGLLVYGIPGFKLEKHVVERRIKRLEESGITFKFNTRIGEQVSLSTLRAEHDTVLIATGVYAAKDLKCPGSGAQGVYPALEYLTASNRKGFGDAVPAYDDGALNAEGKRVVVIGGGDTAMDCVRTAIRQGAKQVTCLYRRDRANMPGSQREVQNAEEEGVVFEWLASPEAILDTKAGKVKAVRANRMKLGEPDASGRQSPVKTGESFDVKADMVIKALGFDPEDLPELFGEEALTVNRWGAVRVDYATMETSLPGVYAAGDIVRGASLVVWAIKDGRDAAEAMHKAMRAAARSETVAAE
ncbi:NAD(P)-dependent oxidoreductase [Hyphomonas pacifica]|uniref:Dihydropyrimidine dehydrogenase subunit A n=1 Tax=Hyphomonas pacifica TaxID=1280941 RepID=A0A062TSK7_9PROT|nr:NAD(P)-dependent oxidoreductase [Hyphomonas pacifica]KCZ50816.1 dihydropyrimidine dehydrogenase subunit A [Hyphomonas pacifica]RAN33329.1 dihydropyrimidine dehydrogenase subunit A [Hyphomonas pacifica]RAN36988.1 dihydropyrimidine dehydrogenase subunit A [Hyphomonas pacifica]